METARVPLLSMYLSPLWYFFSIKLKPTINSVVDLDSGSNSAKFQKIYSNLVRNFCPSLFITDVLKRQIFRIKSESISVDLQISFVIRNIITKI